MLLHLSKPIRRFLPLALGVLLLAGAAHPAAGQMPPSGPATGTAPRLSASLLRDFEADVQAAMQTYQTVGAAVALVEGNQIVYSRGFGLRDEQTGAPVTPRTLFRVGSTTKSMTALLAAILVDDGLLRWDQRLIDIWPDFRAPTPELTQTLRVRDLMGAASGLDEDPEWRVNFSHVSDQSALRVLRSISYLPVVAPPNQEFLYNNVLAAAGGYVGPLALRTPPEALYQTYARLMRERVFGPSGMATAAIGADPRPLTDDYATPYTRNLLGGNAALPFNSIDGLAPAGAGMLSATDMAHYLIVQLNRGIAADGRRIVSAANLQQLWEPHVDIPYQTDVQPDTVAFGYGLGWQSERFRDGRRLLSHGGSIEGSDTVIGVLPDEGIAFFVVTNTQSELGGTPFTSTVQNSLLTRLYGLNRGVNALLAAQFEERMQERAVLGAQAGPVDMAAVAPYLGWYTHNWSLDMADPTTMLVSHDVRSSRLKALPDGDYVGIDGLLVGQRVQFSRDENGWPEMQIVNGPRLVWLSGS
jgi:CubicO group peptidase (beta-lactamase class C family)